jgi:hypothetical protein
LIDDPDAENEDGAGRGQPDAGRLPGIGTGNVNTAGDATNDAR